MPPRQPPRPRSKGFSEAELDFLLETIEQHLPIGGMEWDQVESQHQAAFPHQERTKESLKRKFQTLYRSRMPTGDPNCPATVRRAKHIRKAILDKADLSDGEDKEDAFSHFDEEPQSDEDNINNNNNHDDQSNLNNNDSDDSSTSEDETGNPPEAVDPAL